jgi:multidrug efflux pump
MAELQPSFPKGVQWFAPYDTTDFVRSRSTRSSRRWAEAMVLVFL